MNYKIMGCAARQSAHVQPTSKEERSFMHHASGCSRRSPTTNTSAMASPTPPTKNLINRKKKIHNLISSSLLPLAASVCLENPNTSLFLSAKVAISFSRDDNSTFQRKNFQRSFILNVRSHPKMTDEHPSFSFLPFLCPSPPKGSPTPTNIYLPSSAQVSKYPSKL